MRFIQQYISKNVLFNLLILAALQGCISDKSFVGSRHADSWHLSGKIGIAYPNNSCQKDYCPPRSEQGSIKWQQNKTAYNVTLSDPFGREVIAIAGDSTQLEASSPGASTIYTTPQEFMSLLVGKSKEKAILSSLTPQDLRYWVTGRPVPDVPYQEKGNNRFVQKGFVVASRQWRLSSALARDMPALVIVKQGEFQLRIVIRDWQKLK